MLPDYSPVEKALGVRPVGNPRRGHPKEKLSKTPDAIDAPDACPCPTTVSFVVNGGDKEKRPGRVDGGRFGRADAGARSASLRHFFEVALQTVIL